MGHTLRFRDTRVFLGLPFNPTHLLHLSQQAWHFVNTNLMGAFGCEGFSFISPHIASSDIEPKGLSPREAFKKIKLFTCTDFVFSVQIL